MLDSGNLDSFTRRAKGFLHSQVKSVRMAVRNASEIELLAEELTSNGEGVLNSTSDLEKLASAAMYTNDANCILAVLQQRLEQGGKGGSKFFRMLCKTLGTAEYLLTHGPQHFATLYVARCIDSTEELCNFEHKDDRGFDLGLNVRLKAQRVCELLRDPELLEGERRKAERLVVEMAASSASNPRHPGQRVFGASKSAGSYLQENSSVPTPSKESDSSASSDLLSHEEAESLREAPVGAPHGAARPAGKAWDAFSARKMRSLPAGKAAEVWDPFGSDWQAEACTAGSQQEEATSTVVPQSVGTGAPSGEQPNSPTRSLSDVDSGSPGTPTSVLPDPEQEAPVAHNLRTELPPQPTLGSGRGTKPADSSAPRKSSFRAKSSAASTRVQFPGLTINVETAGASPYCRTLAPLMPLSPPPQPQTPVVPFHGCHAIAADHFSSRGPNLIDF